MRIDEAGLSALAQMIAAADIESPAPHDLEYAVIFNAVNFGSGWHPHLDKDPGASGSMTIMARLRRRFDAEGPLSAEDLARLTPDDCAGLFGQTLRPPLDELIALFARLLNELGRFLRQRFDGSFAALVSTAEGSAVRLVELLQEMPMYRDVTSYEDRTVPFLKRAQITASDIGTLADLDRLTLFADNLVPHVLRLEGVLGVDRGLADAIAAGRLLEPGGRPETELRAAAVHAVELVVTELGGAVTPRQVDSLLWRRGQEARFKAVPRPRVRTIFY